MTSGPQLVAGDRTAVRRQRGAAAIGVAGVALTTVVIVSKSSLVNPDPHPYALIDLALDAAAGQLFVVAGLVARARRPANRVGLLLVLAGFAWMAEDLRFVPTTPAFALGCVLASASAPVLVHLLLAYPDGRLAGRIDRALVATTYAVAAGLVTLGYVLDGDTAYFAAQDRRNVLGLADAPGARDAVGALIGPLTLVVALGVVAVLAGRWARATPPRRRVLAPVLLTGLVGAGAAVGAALTGAEAPAGSTGGVAGVHLGDLAHVLNVAFDWTARLSFLALPLAFLASVLRTRLGRSGLGSLLVQLPGRTTDGDLEVALAEALGDPSLRVLRGNPTATDDGCPPAGRALTPIDHQGRRLGVLAHDPALLEDRYMLDAALTVAALVLENERLAASAGTEAQAAAAAERRRVERNLHDGAQQGMLALAMHLSAARRRVDADADPALAALLDRSAADAAVALADLRAVARGLHPQVLTESGLGAAIEALAESASLPVRVVGIPTHRLASNVETTVFYVVAEAVANATRHADAGSVVVDVRETATAIVVEVVDDGNGGGVRPNEGSGLAGLAERLAALGGHLDISSEPLSGTRLVATIPRRP